MLPAVAVAAEVGGEKRTTFTFYYKGAFYSYKMDNILYERYNLSYFRVGYDEVSYHKNHGIVWKGKTAPFTLIAGNSTKLYAASAVVATISSWPNSHSQDFLYTPEDLYYRGGNGTLVYLQRGVSRKARSEYSLLACAAEGCFGPVYPLGDSYEVGMPDA